jgi:hypothetical protein
MVVIMSRRLGSIPELVPLSRLLSDEQLSPIGSLVADEFPLFTRFTVTK